MRNLVSAREKKDALWQKFQEDLKQAWLKETARYQKAIESLDRDLAAAVIARDEARQGIRQYLSQGPAAAMMDLETEPGEQDWDSLTTGWRQEQHETDASQAVLRRALASTQAAMPSAPMPSAGGIMTPEAAAQLLLATIHGHCPGMVQPTGPRPGTAEPAPLYNMHKQSDGPTRNTAKEAPVPYLNSPSTRTLDPPPTTSPMSSQRTSSMSRPKAQPRQPVKGAPLQPVHTQQPGSLASKLEAKRTQLQQDTQTEGAGGLAPVPIGDTGAGDKPPVSFVADDDDLTEDSQVQTCNRPEGLDGLG